MLESLQAQCRKLNEYINEWKANKLTHCNNEISLASDAKKQLEKYKGWGNIELVKAYVFCGKFQEISLRKS